MWRGGVLGDSRPLPRAPLGQAAVTGWVGSLHRQAPRRVLSVAALLLVLVAVADSVSGTNYSFSTFYLLVVVGVSATGRRPYLVPTALLTAATWTGVEALNRRLEEPWLPLAWNTAARFAVLYLAAVLVAAVVGAARHEREVSRTDPLTGIHNRRGLQDRALPELSRARRTQRPLSVAYLDVDGFKAVNDHSGHAAGDRLLVDVARTLERAMRHYDVVARVGGDEFVVLLPEVGGEQARSTAQRAVDALDDMCRREGWPVRVSVGVATFSEVPATVDDVLAVADGLMYDAKRSGATAGRSTVIGRTVPGASSARGAIA